MVIDPSVKKWRIKANVKFTLYKLANENDTIEYDEKIVWFYHDSSSYYHQNTDISFDALLDENFGFVKNDEMMIETDIRVLEVEGFHQPTVINYRFPPENPENYYSITTSEGVLHCNKDIFDFHFMDHKVSFDSLSNLRSRELMEGLLNCIHGFPVASWYDMIKLSKIFRIRSVARRVEAAVINEHEIDLLYRKISVSFNLRRIMHAWLNRQKSISKKDVKELNIERMSGEVMKAIVKRVLELGWEDEDD